MLQLLIIGRGVAAVEQFDVSKLERWERIDGVIYDMTPPPSSEHQTIIANLIREIGPSVKRKACNIFPAPFAVWLDGNENGNYVEPDITIVCNPNKISHKGCIGAPDMVIEVLSPATAKKDKTLKLRAYKNAGVAIYWVIDPSNQLIEAYEWSLSAFPLIYAKEDSVRINILDGVTIHLQDIFP